MNTKIFEKENIEDKLDFSPEGKSKYGFIITPKVNDKTIYFPNCDAIKEHKDTIRIITVNLFKEEKDKYFEKYKNTIKDVLNEDDYYMDIDEISLSCFMASLGSIVFINTGNDYFKSGFLFIPEKTSINKKLFDDKVNEIINLLKIDNEDISQIFNIPTLEDTLLNKKIFNVSNLPNYNEKENSISMN